MLALAATRRCGSDQLAHADAATNLRAVIAKLRRRLYGRAGRTQKQASAVRVVVALGLQAVAPQERRRGLGAAHRHEDGRGPAPRLALAQDGLSPPPRPRRLVPGVLRLARLAQFREGEKGMVVEGYRHGTRSGGRSPRSARVPTLASASSVSSMMLRHGCGCTNGRGAGRSLI